MQIENTPLAPGHHKSMAGARYVDWSTPGLYVTRLRLLSDPGCAFWDISYCDGEVDGEKVKVDLPFDMLPKRGFKNVIIETAKNEGIFVKGILENVSTLC